MALNDVFHKADSSVSSGGGELIVDGSSGDTGAAEVFEMGGDVDVEVYKETDPDGDGNFEVSVLIDTFAPTSGGWHSQDNGIVVSNSNNHRLRIVNTDGSAGQIYATGIEVSD